MLWNTAAANDYTIEAKDGRFGRVLDLLFEDEGWTIRWIVVGAETAGGRRILLPVSAAGKLDPSSYRIPVDFTIQELNDEPAIEDDYIKRSGTHLRSLRDFVGLDIMATDGEIGHTEHLLIHDGDWSIRFITLDTGNWLAGEKVVISRRAVKEIDWERKTVRLDVDRQTVKDSPQYDHEATVDGAYDETFLTYFGIKFVKK